jgi:hypothetical protein
MAAMLSESEMTARRRTAGELAKTLREADERYVRERFVPLEELCARRGRRPDEVRELIAAGQLPEPAYWLDDGTELVAPEYLDLAGEAEFRERYLAAGGPDPDEAWAGHVAGFYQMCVRNPTPERIANKDLLADAVAVLLTHPRPSDAGWCAKLRSCVERLDELEQPFAPLDRLRFDGARPSRERLIDDPRARWPEVFA